MPHEEITLKDIIISREVQKYCNNPQFKCPNYGHSWACPPEVPYLEKEIGSYARFYLIYTKFDLKAHIEQEKKLHPKRKTKSILDRLYRKNIIRDELEREILDFMASIKEDDEKFLALWDGHCRICSNPIDKGCTHDKGQPCRYPDKIRFSMEAVGINVNETVKNVGIELEWPPKHYLYRFGLVCVGKR